MLLPVHALSNAAELDRQPWFTDLRGSAMGSAKSSETVNRIIQDVRAEGDRALVRYMRRWTDPNFTEDHIRVPREQLDRALGQIDPALRQDLEQSIDHVRAYQQHIMPPAVDPVALDGAELGLRFSPMASVGLAVPGGKAAYPSSVLMLAVPAMVAGVPREQISVVTPPPTRMGDQSAGDISPLVLATCALLGIGRVYRIGGAQAIAALAMGTASVRAVDMIVGPGNIYTQLAKLQLAGCVGIDGFYGPSEILTIADESANPSYIAADLIAQAEHDPGRCFLVAWSRCVIEAVEAQIEEQLPRRTRRAAIERALKDLSAAVLVKDPAVAAEVADRIAAEHVNLAVQDPDAWLERLRHGGEFFLGDRSPVAAGDYWAGPSHCLPTGTTARYASGVSVYTFLRRSGTVRYRQGLAGDAITSIARLAGAEGLEGHAASVLCRR